MEDDNRNMSSRVGSLAAGCTSDLQLVRQQVETLAAQLRAASAQLQAVALAAATSRDQAAEVELSLPRGQTTEVQAPPPPSLFEPRGQPETGGPEVRQQLVSDSEARVVQQGHSDSATANREQRIGPRD
jgi:hypothetical protein